MYKNVFLCFIVIFFCACSQKPTSLEDVTEEVISKKEGVIIEITPEKPRQ